MALIEVGVISILRRKHHALNCTVLYQVPAGSVATVSISTLMHSCVLLRLFNVRHANNKRLLTFCTLSLYKHRLRPLCSKYKTEENLCKRKISLVKNLCSQLEVGF